MSFADIYKKVEAEMERQRLAEEEGRKSRDWMGTLGKVALGAGAGYLTGGLANALLPAALGGTGAGIGAALAPSAANVLPAIQAGSEILKNPDQDALAAGIGKGIEMPMEGMQAKAESSILDKLGYTGRSVKIGGTTGTFTQPKDVIKKDVIKKDVIKKGITEAQARTAVQTLYNNNPDIGPAIEDARAKGLSNLNIYGKLKAKGYIQ